MGKLGWRESVVDWVRGLLTGWLHATAVWCLRTSGRMQPEGYFRNSVRGALRGLWDAGLASADIDGGDADRIPQVYTRATLGQQKPCPLEPTSQMRIDGARRLMSFQDDSTDESFDALQWASSMNEADRVWRSMWSAAP